MWWFIGVAGADTKLHLILGNSDTVLERILVAHSSQLQFSLQCSFGCFLNSRWIEKLFGLDGFLSEEAVDEANEVIDLQKKNKKEKIIVEIFLFLPLIIYFGFSMGAIMSKYLCSKTIFVNAKRLTYFVRYIISIFTFMQLVISEDT